MTNSKQKSEKDYVTMRVLESTHKKLKALSEGRTLISTLDLLVSRAKVDQNKNFEEISVTNAASEKFFQELKESGLLVIRPHVVELTRKSSVISQYDDDKMLDFIASFAKIIEDLSEGEKLLINCTAEKTKIHTVLFRSFFSTKIVDLLLKALNRGVEVYFAGDRVFALDIIKMYTEGLQTTFEERNTVYVGAWNALINKKKAGKYKKKATIKSHIVQSLQWGLGFNKMDARSFLGHLQKAGFQIRQGSMLERKLLLECVESAKDHIERKRMTFKIETDEELQAVLDRMDDVVELLDNVCAGEFTFEDEEQFITIRGKKLPKSLIEKVMEEQGYL